MTVTGRGSPALDALLAYCEQRLRSHRSARNDIGNHKAVAELAAAYALSSTGDVFEQALGRLPAEAMQLERVPGEGGEIIFRIGTFAIELVSVRIRQPMPGIWTMVDRWGDDLVIALHPNAPFDDVTWDDDEWDSPPPDPSIRAKWL
ncbi:MAG: hypothetical protein ABW039_04255 [Sphingobium sp.]